MHRRTPVIVVHPDIDFCKRIEGILADLKCRVEIESPDAVAANPINTLDCQILILHEEFFESNGRTMMAKHQKIVSRVPVILFSDRADLRKAVSAIQNGAYDYFTKNSDDRLIRESLAGAIKITNGKKKDPRNRADAHNNSSIITNSDNMNQVLNVARRVAASSATVLIQGESGTGKELVARFIHQHSGRRKNPFVATNCAALPDNLAESELFGYERGAFTGATQNRVGKFEQAHGGTLLLDEISEMPLSLQVKLLRVLQEKEVDPIGGKKTIPVDARVIATSNKDLGKMVKDGQFRQDLYYRLRVIPLNIPPLREREADVALLVDYFIKKFTAPGRNCDIHLSSAALDQLSKFTWPGNVRELENAIERAVLICEGSVIGPEHLLLDHDVAKMDNSHSAALVGMTVKEMEKRLIGQTLKQVNDNRTHAAKMLGISIRTLRNKLREYNNPDTPAQNPAIAI
jgi:two-component system response regulator FlrC